MKTYVAMSGTPGCLPDYSGLHTSRRAAEDAIISMFNLAGTRLAGALRRNGIVYFGKRAAELGAEYAAVTESDNMTKAEYAKASEQW